MADAPDRPRQVLILAVAVVALTGLIAGGYLIFLEPPEAKVRRTMARIVEGAGERNPRAVSSELSEDFKARYRRSSPGKDEAHRAMVQLFLMDYKHGFRVSLDPEVIPVALSKDGKTATSRFRLTAEGKATKESEFVPVRYAEAKGRIEWEATFVDTDDGWKLHALGFARD
jgi:hypothetical protein